jgi:hypothetical protein
VKKGENMRKHFTLIGGLASFLFCGDSQAVYFSPPGLRNQAATPQIATFSADGYDDDTDDLTQTDDGKGTKLTPGEQLKRLLTLERALKSEKDEAKKQKLEKNIQAIRAGKTAPQDDSGTQSGSKGSALTTDQREKLEQEQDELEQETLATGKGKALVEARLKEVKKQLAADTQSGTGAGGRPSANPDAPTETSLSAALGTLAAAGGPVGATITDLATRMLGLHGFRKSLAKALNRAEVRQHLRTIGSAARGPAAGLPMLQAAKNLGRKSKITEADILDNEPGLRDLLATQPTWFIEPAMTLRTMDGQANALLNALLLQAVQLETPDTILRDRRLETLLAHSIRMPR